MLARLPLSVSWYVEKQKLLGRKNGHRKIFKWMISLFLAESQLLCPYHIFCRYPPIPDSHTFWIAPHTKYINWKHWSRKHWSRKHTILLNVLFSFLPPAFESFRDLQARSSFCPKQKTCLFYVILLTAGLQNSLFHLSYVE